MPHGFRGIFLAGTDTAVGKTTVGCALLRLCLQRGQSFVPFKPAETDADPLPRDAERLRIAAGRTDLALAEICPFSFAAPLAPAAAAALVGTTITLTAVLAAAAHLARGGSPLLVESAGGLLTPYGADLTSAQIATALGLPLLLIARNSLGTVNHTALAIAEIRRRDIPLAGLILVNTSPSPTPDQASNAALITSLTGVTPLGILPYILSTDPDQLAAAFAQAVTTDSLFAAAFGPRYPK